MKEKKRSSSKNKQCKKRNKKKLRRKKKEREFQTSHYCTLRIMLAVVQCDSLALNSTNENIHARGSVEIPHTNNGRGCGGVDSKMRK
jgi:hypothetical protein